MASKQNWILYLALNILMALNALATEEKSKSEIIKKPTQERVLSSTLNYEKSYDSELVLRENISYYLNPNNTALSNGWIAPTFAVYAMSHSIGLKSETFDEAYNQTFQFVLYAEAFPDSARDILTEKLNDIVNTTRWARHLIKLTCKDHLNVVPCNVKMAVISIFLSSDKRKELDLLNTIGQLAEYHTNDFKYLKEAIVSGKAYDTLIKYKEDFKRYILKLAQIVKDNRALKFTSGGNVDQILRFD